MEPKKLVGTTVVITLMLIVGLNLRNRGYFTVDRYVCSFAPGKYYDHQCMIDTETNTLLQKLDQHYNSERGCVYTLKVLQVGASQSIYDSKTGIYITDSKTIDEDKTIVPATCTSLN